MYCNGCGMSSFSIGDVISIETAFGYRGYRLVLDAFDDMVKIYPNYGNIQWHPAHYYKFEMKGPVSLIEGKRLVNVLNKLQ